MGNDEKIEKLVAACWAMYSAIMQAQSADIYNGSLKSLASIARNSMIRAGQLYVEEEVTTNE